MLDQAELALTRKPSSVTVPIEIVRSQKSSGAAFALACQASGLEDKEIAMACNLDAGYFARIKKNLATLQGNELAGFCKVVGNTIYPEWLAYQVGCTLVIVQSEAERRALLAEERANEAEKKLQWALEVLRSGGAS